MKDEKTKVAEPRFLGDRRLAIPCDCAGGCSILFLTEYEDDSSSCFDFYTAHREDTWRHRLRSAWLTLRGKGGYYHGIVATPEQAEQLGRWLLDLTAPAPDTPTSNPTKARIDFKENTDD